jgi:ribonuclease HI
LSPVLISTDGSGIATGGPGGWAAVLRHGDAVKEISGSEREATNNSMEMLAAIKALQTLRRPCDVILTTDSEYLMHGADRYLSGWKRFGWTTAEGKPVKNKELWLQLDEQLRRHRVAWVHVPGHSGHVDNERCDVLAGTERLKLKDRIDGIDTGAVFSPDRLYRYSLWRIWGAQRSIESDGHYTPRLVNFLMLNPSTADEVVNDATVERCERRARSWGYDGLIVTNIFAYRATDPEVLKTVSDPVGPENDLAIRFHAGDSALVVAAWGNHGELLDRSKAVKELLSDVTLYCLKVSKTGEPAHPLYLPYKLEPKLYG